MFRELTDRVESRRLNGRVCLSTGARPVTDWLPSWEFQSKRGRRKICYMERVFDVPTKGQRGETLSFDCSSYLMEMIVRVAISTFGHEWVHQLRLYSLRL